uniref:Uncharacterized protein n=1 Tax=Oryza meridionalis TaxID=40149 RepID=A0A0E0EVW5_9ORYZ
MLFYAPTSNPTISREWTNHVAPARAMQLLLCAIVALAAYPVVAMVTHTISWIIALPEYNAPEQGEIPKNAKVYLILSRGLEK